MKLKQAAIFGAICMAVLSMTAGPAIAAPNGNSASSMTNVAVHGGKIHHEGGQLPEGIAKIFGSDRAGIQKQLQAGKTLAQIASEKGLDTKNLTKKIEVILDQRLDKAVKDGKLTKEKAAALKKKNADKASSIVNDKWLGRGHKHELGAFQGVKQQIQTSLGIDSDTLKKQLHAGQSLAELAQAKGISGQDLSNKIKEKVFANIDQALQEGKLSSDEAAKMKSEVPIKIQSMLSNKHTAKNN